MVWLRSQLEQSKSRMIGVRDDRYFISSSFLPEGGVSSSMMDVFVGHTMYWTRNYRLLDFTRSVGKARASHLKYGETPPGNFRHSVYCDMREFECIIRLKTVCYYYILRTNKECCVGYKCWRPVHQFGQFLKVKATIAKNRQKVLNPPR